jgi:hypothetical protein
VSLVDIINILDLSYLMCCDLDKFCDSEPYIYSLVKLFYMNFSDLD